MTHLQRLLLCFLLLAATCGLRAPFLQRAIWNVDEGITVTAAARILSGGVLYRDVADQRSPLVPYLKAGILAVCGDWNTTAVHVVLAVLLGLGAIALWQIARRLGHDRVGLVAAVVFTVLSFMLPGEEDALAAHTEWFLMLFSVAGFLAFVAAIKRPGFVRGLGVGALFGLSTLCKQPGLFDWAVSLVLIGLLLFARPAAQRGALLRLAGGSVTGLVLLAGLTFGYFAYRGAVPDLVYYAWTYNNQVYVPAIPLAARLLTMREPFFLAAQHAPAVLLLGLCGALVLPVLAIRGLFRWPVEIALLPWLALGWTAAGILACSLSGRAFSHYSIQVIPGLSLVCGWVLVAGWDWCVGRKRAWRLAAMALLALAVADTGGRIARRVRTTHPEDYEWTACMRVVRQYTTPNEHVFFWGFTPDCYVHVRRLPATRFVYTTFLTGLIPWANIDPLIDTKAIVTPGSWDQLQEDFRRNPPAMIIGTGSVREQNKYPLLDQPRLWSLVTRDFAEVNVVTGGFRDFRFYRRLDPVVARPLPAEAVADATVSLKLGYTPQVRSIPQLVITAPPEATRIELFANGQLLRSLATVAGEPGVAIFLPPAALTAETTVFAAVAHCPTGLRLSAPVTLTRTDAAWHGRHAPGPAIQFLGGEIQPAGSETKDGQPVCTSRAPEIWRTPTTARLVYDRPAGLRAFTFTFGMDEAVYYDRPDQRASDGVDFVVEYLDSNGANSRLYTRRLHPKTNQNDCAPQTAEVSLPDSGAGQIVLRVLPGPKNNEENDRAYLGVITASAYGPPAAWREQAIPAERVSAHGEPVMTCDPEGKWTAHSPSSISYELPVGARALAFDYGLEPASYDGSQSGRTDGIDIVVTGETAEGGTSTMFRRTINPAEVAGDRGRQTARIALADTGVRRVTIAVGPGPNDNFSFDWSYLTNLRLEGSAAAGP